MKSDDVLSRIVVQLGWTEVWVGVAILVVLQLLVALWIKTRIEGSIKHEYDRRLKDYEFTLKKREQAVRIAQVACRFFLQSEDR